MAKNVRAAKALAEEAEKLAKHLEKKGFAETEVVCDAREDGSALCQLDLAPVDGSLTAHVTVCLSDAGKKGAERFGASVALQGNDGLTRYYEGCFAEKREAASFVKGCVQVAAGAPDRTE